MTYTAKINVGGKDITATGSDPEEALLSLQVPKTRYRAVISLSGGDKMIERIIAPPLIHRAFHAHGLTKEIGIKNLLSILV